MKYPGLKRVKEVYLVWTAIYAIIFLIMILMQIRLPQVILAITIFFSLKTLLIDYRIVKFKRKRVYWLEHGPFLAEIIIIGLFSLSGIEALQGYVDFPTIIIAV